MYILTQKLNSLSRGEELEIRAPLRSLEHISEVLARISATLDRRQMGKLQERGGDNLVKHPELKIQPPPRDYFLPVFSCGFGGAS